MGILGLCSKRSQLEILSDLITSLDNTEIQGFVVKCDREDAEQNVQGFALMVEEAKGDESASNEVRPVEKSDRSGRTSLN